MLKVCSIISLIALTTLWPVVTSVVLPSAAADDDAEFSLESSITQLRSNRTAQVPLHPFYLDGMSSLDDEDMSNEFALSPASSTDWDVLIFTQQWPVTSCYQWEEENRSHICALPGKKKFWTIHGIWPTKLGHMGPNFCNKSAAFDVDQLELIRAQLDQYWPTIHGAPDDQSDDLWKHEWLKHGTCASVIAPLSNELKYFAQGLMWRDSHLIASILEASGIHPDTDSTVTALNTALVKVLGRNPSIHCLYDSKDDISYLLEIRICFDKQMQLVDCDGVKLDDTLTVNYPGGTLNTNCHVSKPVHYPSVVPPLKPPTKQRKWEFPVVNVYKLVKMMMWYTL